MNLIPLGFAASPFDPPAGGQAKEGYPENLRHYVFSRSDQKEQQRYVLYEHIFMIITAYKPKYYRNNFSAR